MLTTAESRFDYLTDVADRPMISLTLYIYRVVTSTRSCNKVGHLLIYNSGAARDQ